MIPHLLHRIPKELTLTLTGLRETILAVSERVNRKVQVLKIHWQASLLCDRVESLHHDVGHALCRLLDERRGLAEHELEPSRPQALLLDAQFRLRGLKQELLHLDQVVRVLEDETLRDDLLRVQHDLSARGYTVRRVPVPPGAAVIGRTGPQLELPPAIRIVTVFRGAALSAQPDAVVFRAGDVVVLLGPRADLEAALPCFHKRRQVPA